ncbi:MAG: glycosyltransferase [Chloroflexota bacterium]
MSRFARSRRVFFFEEPLPGAGPAHLEITVDSSGVQRVVPRLPELPPHAQPAVLGRLLADLFASQDIQEWIAWYYTPMALRFTRGLRPQLTIYDCMDELSAFKFAPTELTALEDELLQRSDLVFTGGHSLYEAKCRRHPHVHAFPSSVDVAHFRRARQVSADPADQAAIPGPRLGYFGVIDERLDLELLRGLAELRPDWQIVLVGPTAKIDPTALPQRPNIHYLGMRPYAQLPDYLAGWDVAIMPFARNESTRYISPTKTPEYLAGGRPVVSTSITDVVRPYGEQGLVWIADTPAAFAAAAGQALRMDGHRTAWLEAVDRFLATRSWDHTWQEMAALIEQRRGAPAAPEIAV